MCIIHNIGQFFNHIRGYLVTKLNKILLGAGVLYAFSPVTFSHAEEGKAYVAGNFGVGISAK